MITATTMTMTTTTSDSIPPMLHIHVCLPRTLHTDIMPK